MVLSGNVEWMVKPKILFATKVWGGDFAKFLSGAFDRKWQSCCYPFTHKWLFINNGVPDNASFDAITVKVSDYENKVLKFFNLTKDDFKGGYYYSIEELTELYLADEFDYLCHLSSDSIITPKGDWITPGIKILENEPNVSVVSPFSECNKWDRKDYDNYFSDQGYLIRVKEFRQQIYNYRKPELPDYPPQSGETFEKRVAQYLINNNKKRRILYEFYLAHPQY